MQTNLSSKQKEGVQNVTIIFSLRAIDLTAGNHKTCTISYNIYFEVTFHSLKLVKDFILELKCLCLPQ